MTLISEEGMAHMTSILYYRDTWWYDKWFGPVQWVHGLIILQSRCQICYISEDGMNPGRAHVIIYQIISHMIPKQPDDSLKDYGK